MAASVRQDAQSASMRDPAASLRTLDRVEKTLRRSSRPDGDSASPINLSKVQQLLTSEHTHDLHDKHVHVLKKVGSRNAGGYLLKDVSSLAALLSTLNSKLEQHVDIYRNSLCLCLTPLQKEFVYDPEEISTVSQAEAALSSIAGLFDSLSDILCCGDFTVVSCCAIALCVMCKGLTSDILSHVVKAALPGNVSATSQSTQNFAQIADVSRSNVIIAYALNQSRVPGHLSKALLAIFDFVPTAATANKEEVDIAQLALLQVVRLLTSCPAMVPRVLSVPIVSALITALASDSCDVIGQEGSMLMDIIWNIFSVPDVKESCFQQASSHSVSKAIGHVFRKIVQSAKSDTARGTRNDIMMLIDILSESSDIRELFTEDYVFEYVARFATAGEVRTHHPDCRNIKWTASLLDFEFVKIALNTIVKYAESSAAMEMFASCGAMPFFKQFLACENKSTRGWLDVQYEELQLISLSVLSAVIPHLLDEYAAERMNAVVIALLMTSLKYDSGYTGPEAPLFAGSGNAFLATGDFSHGRALSHDPEQASNNGLRSQSRMALRLLLRIAEFKSKRAAELQDDLNDQGLVAQLVDFLDDPVPGKADETCLELRYYALLLCSALCCHRQHACELFGKSGVTMLLIYLKDGPQHLVNCREKLMMAVVDAIWSCVVKSETTEAEFLEQEGVFFLTDLLQASSFEMKNQILGCLSDLCSNTQALEHLLSWKGTGQPRANVASLLCDIWRSACSQLQCPSLNADGLIRLAVELEEPLEGKVPAQFMHPLKGREQLDREEETEACQSHVVHDLLSNVRAKISGLCQQIGYEACNNMLPTADRAVMVLIEHYNTLKAGEVWAEIRNALADEGVVPLNFDEELLNLAETVHQELITDVINKQRQLYRAQMSAARASEELEFIRIKEMMAAKTA